MKEAGLTVDKLANRSGISRTAIYKWMYDEDRPTEDSMVKLCHALGVNLQEGLREYVPKRNGRPPQYDDRGKRKGVRIK